MTTETSFHGRLAMKDAYLENGRAYKVRGNQARYTAELGLPAWLGLVEDVFTSHSPQIHPSQIETPSFIRAVPVGLSQEEFESVKDLYAKWLVEQLDLSIRLQDGRERDHVISLMSQVSDSENFCSAATNLVIFYGGTDGFTYNGAAGFVACMSQITNLLNVTSTSSVAA